MWFNKGGKIYNSLQNYQSNKETYFMVHQEYWIIQSYSKAFTKNESAIFSISNYAVNFKKEKNFSQKEN